jgi:hypothetical protein
LAQLISANEASDRTARNRIDMDGPFNDALNGAGGLAGAGLPGDALVSRYLGVTGGIIQPGGQRGGFRLHPLEVSLHPVKTPRLDAR